MIAAKSTTKKNAWKSAKKPYADFALRPHASGYWCKKIRQKTRYFGPRYCDWQTALDAYLDQKDDLHAGRKPRVNRTDATIADFANEFLEQQDKVRLAKNQTRRNFVDKVAAIAKFLKSVDRDRYADGLRPDDFLNYMVSISKLSKHAQFREIGHVKHLLNWLKKVKHIEVDTGDDFRAPSEDELLADRDEKGDKYIEPETIRELLANPKTSPHMKAFTLLALNCGIQNSDLARMKPSHIKGNVLSYARGKTDIPRKAILWPETLKAIEMAINEQPKGRRKKETEGLLFVTPDGQRWADHEKGTDRITTRFKRALERIDKYQPGKVFTGLRSSYRTAVDDFDDQRVVDLSMGHKPVGMGARRYRVFVRRADERLEKLAKHAHQWLWPDVDSTIHDEDGE